VQERIVVLKYQHTYGSSLYGQVYRGGAVEVKKVVAQRPAGWTCGSSAPGLH